MNKAEPIKRKPHQYEAVEQEKLFNWLAFMSNRYPELELAHHIPNGGSRNVREAAHLKRQGVKSGVPDVFLPVARGGYHGLYMELKYGANKPTENQKKWLAALSKQGYATGVCYDWEQAAEMITKYMKFEKEF